MGVKGKGAGAPLKGRQTGPKDLAAKAKERLAEGSLRDVSEEPDGQHRIPGMPRKTHTAIEGQALRVAKAKTAKTRANRKFNEETDILTKMMIEAHMAAGEPMDISNGLETLLDQEPKAVVRKKKDPKNTRPQAHEGDEGDEDEQ